MNSETMDDVTNAEAKAALRNVGPLLQVVAMAHGGKLELTPAGASYLETILRFTEEHAFSAIAQPAALALPFDEEDVARLKHGLTYLRKVDQDCISIDKLAALAYRLEAALPGQGAEAGKMVPCAVCGSAVIEQCSTCGLTGASPEIDSLRRELDEAREKAERLMHQSEAFEAEAERLRGVMREVARQLDLTDIDRMHADYLRSAATPPRLRP